MAVFDKTGTLTAGIPSLANGDTVDSEALALPRRWRPQAAILMRKRSSTPRRSGSNTVPSVSGVEEVPGFGLRRITAAGEERLGSAAWCDIDAKQAASASLWFIRPGVEPVAFHFEDKLREDAAETVDALRQGAFRGSALFWGPPRGRGSRRQMRSTLKNGAQA